MPSATLHVTHARMLAEDPGLAEPLARAMRDERICTRLGAVLVDLPFYTNIVTMMLGYWLEMPAERCPFAQEMHRHHPDLFAWHLMRYAHQDRMLPEPRRLALLGGFFSHVALDLELHPLVNWIARRDRIDYGGNESHHHRLAEKFHSLFFHRLVEGRDIVGTRRVFTEATRIVDHAAFVRADPDPAVVRWLADLIAGFYPAPVPGAREVAGWIRAFRHFGFMVSLPFATKNSYRTGNAANRRRYFENETFSFMEHYRRAYRRSLELMNLAHATYVAGDFSAEQREAFRARAGIGDLSEPPSRGRVPAPAAGPKLIEGDGGAQSRNFSAG